jgi:ribose transport system permease protein
MNGAKDHRFPAWRASALLRNRAFLTVLIVALVWIVTGFAKPGFGAYGHLRYLLELAAVIGLVAIGQTYVVIAGGIDLSVGAIVTVSAVGVPLVALSGDTTGVFAVIAILAAATSIGLLNGLGVAYLRIHPMIMTLAMATFLQGVLILIAGGTAISAQNPLLAWLGNARIIGIPASVILWTLMSGVALAVLHATPFGARLFALGANPLASALSGVNVQKTTMAVYAVSGLTAGLAGVLVLGMNGQGYVGIGDPYLLASIAAVVLGGTSILGGSGSYAGTIPGAILLVTITALITVVNASAGWRSILFGSLILLLLLLSGRESQRR